MRISAQKVVLTSFIVDTLDVVINLIVMLATGSVVMLSELLQGGADLVAAGMLLIGLKRSRPPADKQHPFGQGKEIYFWTLLSALVMFTVAAGFSLYFGWQRFIKPEPVHNIYLAYGGLIFATITNGYAFSLSFRRLLGSRNPKRILNIFLQSSLVESKNTFILDFMGTSAAFIGLIALILYQVTGEMRFDGIGAMSMGIVLSVLAFFLVLGVKDFLIGKGASAEIEQQIRDAALTVPQVLEVLDLKTMQIGVGKLLVNLEVHMKDRLTTDELEILTDKIKSRVRQEVPSIGHIQVELESPDS